MKHVRIYRPENGRLDIRHKHLFIGANSAVGFESEVVFVPGAPDPVVSNAYEKAIEDFPGENIDYLNAVEETNYRNPALYQLNVGGSEVTQEYKAIVFYGNESETEWFGLFMKLYQLYGDWVPVTDFVGEISATVEISNVSESEILGVQNLTFTFSEGEAFGKLDGYLPIAEPASYAVKNPGMLRNLVSVTTGESPIATPVKDVHVMIIK